MKKFILLPICFFCLLTSIFAESINGALSLSGGIKFNSLSTEIPVNTNNGHQYNLIDWAGLESSPSFAIGLSYEWYSSDYPIYVGIVADFGVGDITTFDPGIKMGYYNNYINLFCKVGFSNITAEMDATNDVYWSKNGDISKIDSFCFTDLGYNFGLGLDVHPSRKPFFIRLAYDYEDFSPDIEMKTSSFTERWKSEDIRGDNGLSNSSFTIAVGWQFKRKNIVAYN